MFLSLDRAFVYFSSTSLCFFSKVPYKFCMNITVHCACSLSRFKLFICSLWREFALLHSAISNFNALLICVHFLHFLKTITSFLSTEAMLSSSLGRCFPGTGVRNWLGNLLISPSWELTGCDDWLSGTGGLIMHSRLALVFLSFNSDEGGEICSLGLDFTFALSNFLFFTFWLLSLIFKICGYESRLYFEKTTDTYLFFNCSRSLILSYGKTSIRLKQTEIWQKIQIMNNK